MAMSPNYYITKYDKRVYHRGEYYEMPFPGHWRVIEENYSLGTYIVSFQDDSSGRRWNAARTPEQTWSNAAATVPISQSLIYDAVKDLQLQNTRLSDIATRYGSTITCAPGVVQISPREDSTQEKRRRNIAKLAAHRINKNKQKE